MGDCLPGDTDPFLEPDRLLEPPGEGERDFLEPSGDPGGDPEARDPERAGEGEPGDREPERPLLRERLGDTDFLPRELLL